MCAACKLIALVPCLATEAHDSGCCKQDVSGVFQPGVLTALVGVSGAGKTTLMDCLAGRKTTGKIQGDIRVNVRCCLSSQSPACHSSAPDCMEWRQTLPR